METAAAIQLWSHLGEGAQRLTPTLRCTNHGDKAAGKVRSFTWLSIAGRRSSTRRLYEYVDTGH